MRVVGLILISISCMEAVPAASFAPTLYDMESPKGVILHDNQNESVHDGIHRVMPTTHNPQYSLKLNKVENWQQLVYEETHKTNQKQKNLLFDHVQTIVRDTVDTTIEIFTTPPKHNKPVVQVESKTKGNGFNEERPSVESDVIWRIYYTGK